MLLLALLLSYFIGAIPFGLLVGKLRGVDIRDVGSGNIGATNVWRTLGPVAGSIVFALDVLKGLAGSFIGRALLGSEATTGIALCALLAVLGHTFSVFLKFRGGKGIATGLGVAAGLMPLVALSGFGLWCGVLAVTRMVGAASVAACIAIPLVALALNGPLPYVLVISGMVLVALLKHVPNIKRIMAGTEPKIGQPKPAETVEPASMETANIETAGQS